MKTKRRAFSWAARCTAESLLVLLAGSLLALLVAWGLARSVYWKGASVGSSPPLPTHYGEIFSKQRPWRMAEAAPAPPPHAPVAALWGDNVVAQSYRAGADNLAQMRLWLAGPEGAEVYVELRQGRERDATLYHTRLSLHAAQHGRYYYVSFPRLPDSQAQMYWLVLSSTAPSREQAVIVRTTTGSWLGGAFSINDYPHPGSLDLATYHRGPVGLWILDAVGESILPRVFRDRLGQYKPSLLKAPTFALLLALSGAGTLGLLGVVWALIKDRGSRMWLAALTLGTLVILASRWMIFPGTATIRLQAGPAGILPTAGGERVFLDLVAALQKSSRKPDPRLIAAGWCGNRACLLAPPETKITYSLRVPPNARLRLATGRSMPARLGTLDQLAGRIAPPQGPSASLTFVVKANGEELTVQHMEGSSDLGTVLKQGQEVALDLASFAGQDIKLSLECTTGAEPEGREAHGVRGLWITPQVVGDMDWLLDGPPDNSPPTPQTARFGSRDGPADEIELLGYDLHADGVRSGDVVSIAFYWRTLRPAQISYTVFVHLLDETGEIRGQADSRPVAGTYPTTYWPTDKVVVDQRLVPLAADAPPGTYRITVGLYDLGTMVRLPVTDAAGQPLPDGRLILDGPLLVKE